MPIRVLLVEDDTLTRRNTALYLRRAQIEVDEAADGNEAIRLITSIDQYDVLISDLRMPGRVDGMEVITHQQQSRPVHYVFLLPHLGPIRFNDALRISL